MEGPVSMIAQSPRFEIRTRNDVQVSSSHCAHIFAMRSYIAKPLAGVGLEALRRLEHTPADFLHASLPTFHIASVHLV
jgi:hypothetical protein